MRLKWLKQALSTLALALLICHVSHGLLNWLFLLFLDKAIAVTLVSVNLALGRLLFLLLDFVSPGLSSSISGG